MFSITVRLFNRERTRIGGELRQVGGLMPLLMKRRNGRPWTREDQDQIHARLWRLYKISPYLVVFVLPGSFLLVPMLAWWMDRRRTRRPPDQQGMLPG